MLQSKWRNKKGYPIASNDGTTNYGHFMETGFAVNEKANFLTENIRKLVIETLETKEIVQEYIYENLFSSKSLSYNLFGELNFNHDLATSLFKNVFPKAVSRFSEKLPEIGKVTSVLFDHSPYKTNNNFAEAPSYFDVFIEYISNDGKKGFIGIDVKYAETLLEETEKASEISKKYEHNYLKLATEDLFLQEHLDKFKKPPLFQLWHKHLLSLSILRNHLYEEGFFLFLFPNGNEECYKEASQYRSLQKFPYRWDEHRTGYYWRFLDEFIEHLDKLVDENWTKELIERYLGK